jgi:hypothetical protein
LSINIGSPPGSAPEWTAIATLSPAAVNTISPSVALPAFKTYRITYKLVNSGVGTLLMTINAVGGTAYQRNAIDETTALWSVTAGSAAWNIENQTIATQASRGVMILEGISPAVASGKVGMSIVPSGMPGNSLTSTGGNCTLGSAVQVTTFTITQSVGTFTGTIIIEGRNDI